MSLLPQEHMQYVITANSQLKLTSWAKLTSPEFETETEKNQPRNPEKKY